MRKAAVSGIRRSKSIRGILSGVANTMFPGFLHMYTKLLTGRLNRLEM